MVTVNWRATGDDDPLLELPTPPRSRWHRAGMGTRGQRWFNGVVAAWCLLFAFGWTWTIASARADGGRAGARVPSAGAVVASALTDPSAPTASFVTDAALDAMVPRGLSGKLRAAFLLPGESLEDDAAENAAAARRDTALAVEEPGAPPGRAPARNGIFRVAVKVRDAVRPVEDYRVVTLVPYDRLANGRIGQYMLGTWPAAGGALAKKGDYSRPQGFIEVTPQNQDTPVSEHFRLRDFLTHDQANVWPKYLVLRIKNVDKVELTLVELERRGIDVRRVKVLSGFRTPRYNVGGGDPSGRAKMSRHMFGDAADVFVDADGDGNMDDLNHDGKVNVGDARVVCEAVETVERTHPELIGGCGVYPATGAHGPFAHIDTRGYRARWNGTGD